MPYHWSTKHVILRVVLRMSGAYHWSTKHVILRVVLRMSGAYHWSTKHVILGVVLRMSDALPLVNKACHTQGSPQDEWCPTIGQQSMSYSG